MHGAVRSQPGRKGPEMRWRLLLAVLLGFLLPLPLLWAFSRLLPGWDGTLNLRPDSGDVVPRLSSEEASQRLTYLRPCLKDEDCEAPLVCLRGRGLLGVKAVCTSSQCQTDKDCSEGFTCHAVPVGPHRVRLCEAQGRAGEGASCLILPRDQEMGCEEGLVCADSWCRRRCNPHEPQSCPEGSFCGTGHAGDPLCLPTCEGRSCPEGQQCVRLNHGGSVCARLHGTNCQRDACPTGQVCDVTLPSRENAGEAWMRCQRPCDKESPSCPENTLCMAERCRQRCDPGTAYTCGPGEKCMGWGKYKLWLCVLDTGP